MRNLLLRLLYYLLRLTRPHTQTPARTILILQYQMPLGCCVHGTPIYAAFRQADPAVTVIVATRGLGYATLQHDPHIDHLLQTADPMPSFLSKRRIAAHIRRELRRLDLHPDLILTDGSSKAGSFALLAALLRLAPTKGFGNAAALYDVPMTYDFTQSLIANNLRLVHNAPHLEPAVYFTSQDLAFARDLLHEANLESLPLVALAVQGSGGQSTSWHDDRFAEVIRYVESSGCGTMFLGTAADASAIDRIRALAASSGFSAAGRTSIPQLAALLTLCDLLVSIDTGTMHVGRASGLPMVVLGPSWQRPVEWLPLDRNDVRILRGEDRPTCPPNYKLDEIQASEVQRACTDLLTAYAPSAAAREKRIARLLTDVRAQSL